MKRHETEVRIRICPLHTLGTESPLYSSKESSIRGTVIKGKY